jgi:HlyD family secretion protein
LGDQIFMIDAELKNLQIDRTRRRSAEPSKWATRWIITGVVILLLLGGWRFAAEKLNPVPVVEVQRVRSISAASAPEGVILNATGYIVAAHKIEVAAKVIGRVKWIGVDKGDRVKEGEVLVRLEDDEYQAQLMQAKGQLTSLEAKLAEAMNGSRPEEVAQAQANVNTAQSDLDNARVTLDRNKNLLKDGVVAKQVVDDAQARYDNALHRVISLQKTYELVKLGPRKEQVDSLRGQVDQARGAVNYAQTNLANTIIRAPVTGTILERAVEKGEFVTTSFVGDRGAKGYVVSLADLNDLEVELDIAQNDFAKLHANQHGAVTTDAFPDRKYDGFIKEISPEANRQKATVQVKVKISQPDTFLRPEMNASVAFASEENAGQKSTRTGSESAAKPVVIVPASALHDGAVFVLLDGKALRRAVKTGATSAQGVRVEQGLVGGEDLITNPPPGLKDGDKVRQKAATS